MAKLHFKYAAMNAGKSIDLMRTAYNCEENGFKVLVMKPKIDTKDDDYISSRIGLKRKVDILIDKEDNIPYILRGKLEGLYAVLIDEAQFLGRKQIDDLYMICKIYDIPVICYGLRVNFLNESFEGSMRLLELADELLELETLCSCGRIARISVRKVNNEFVNFDEEIVIDGADDVLYVPLCGNCYLEKLKKINFKDFKEKLR